MPELNAKLRRREAMAAALEPLGNCDWLAAATRDTKGSQRGAVGDL